jgi:tRNA(Ile)-lysidine synthase TilS/MesJ
MFQDIKDSLRQLYLDDQRPWLVGFSGGKDSIRQPTDWRR